MEITQMLLVTSSWKDKRTFKMIPITQQCPYNECIFDPISKVLAVVSKEKKENYHIIPKMSDNGDLLLLKNGKRVNGKDYAEQRVLLDTYYEYFIQEKSEILDFITQFGINASTYSYVSVIDKAFAEVVEENTTTS